MSGTVNSTPRAARLSLLAPALLACLSAVATNAASAADAAKPETRAEKGYRLLTTKAYLPPDFDQETFDNVWKVWPEPLRSQAERAAPEQRRRMAYSRYGLTERPGDSSGKPLQYVVDDKGNWTMNCLACHGGKVAGKVIPGLPNSHFALQTLTDEIREAKILLTRPFTRMDYGSVLLPLGQTNGTTNSVMFGVVLLAYRDEHLHVHRGRRPPPLVNHDMDAIPWWHFKRKTHLYVDGFAQKSFRPLMQFMLVKENGPERFMRDWVDDFLAVSAYLESIEPPKYPYAIDQPLADEGRVVFEQNCARCHGTYGKGGKYPEVNVPLEEIGTDPVRYHALSPERRAHYAKSWFGDYGRANTIIEPPGYVAPPLDGVWASAPYFHNGSVPTLWHVLHPGERPAVWRRSENGYDQQRVGLEVESLEKMPADVTDAWKLRTFFDTSRPGMGNGGHLFPDELDEQQKRSVLEYLKTL